MKNILKNSLPLIFEIANKNDADIGVARDMLVANLEAGDTTYPMGSFGLNPAAVKAWQALDNNEKAAEKNAVQAVIRTHYRKLVALYAEQDFEAMYKLANEDE